MVSAIPGVSPSYTMINDPVIKMCRDSVNQASLLFNQATAGQTTQQSGSSFSAASIPGGGSSGGFFGAFTAVFRGVKNGLVNTVKSLLTPKGLIMAAAGVVLTVATGGAAVPFMAAIGVGIGGFQIARNGFTAAQLYWQGRGAEAEKAMEGVGEGIFTAGTSALSAYFGQRTFKAADGTIFKMPDVVPKEGSLIARTVGTVRSYVSVLTGKTELVSVQSPTPAVGFMDKLGTIGRWITGRSETAATTTVVTTGKTITLGTLAKGNLQNFLKADPMVLSVKAWLSDLRGAVSRRNGATSTADAAGAIAGEARGFSAARIRAGRALITEYRGLVDMANSPTGTLTPLEQARLNIFGSKMGDVPSSLLNGKLGAAQVLWGGFRTYPDSVFATSGILNGFNNLSAQG